MREKLSHVNSILIFLFLVIAGLYFGASILIPFTFAIFFSTLLLPVSNFLERKGMGRITSSFISTFLLFVGVGLTFSFLVRQMGVFATDLVERKDEIGEYVVLLQKEIGSITGFSLEEQEEALRGRLAELFNFAHTFVSGLLGSLAGMIINFLLVLIYMFLLLLNRNKFVHVLMMYIPEERRRETNEILSKSKRVANKYLWGRLQVMFYLGIMYTITFLAFDLPYAALLIVFGMIITIIPYIGPLLSGVLPVLFMIIFGGSYMEIMAFAGIVFIIQLIESYVLEPVIIGSEIQQSPLFVIIAVIVGGALWGAAGLILFVPIFGILKILFDHTKGLKPVGFLIGYERPGAGESFIEKIKKKLKS